MWHRAPFVAQSAIIGGRWRTGGARPTLLCFPPPLHGTAILPQTVILAADIGGTVARFGRYADGRRLATVALETGSYETPAALLRAAATALPGADAAGAIGLAVAGPVLGDSARLTNGHLEFSRGDIGRAFATGRVALVNDIVALGAAVDALPASGFSLLSGPDAVGGSRTKGIVAAGTGLGMGIVVDGRCLPSEGGHARVAPAGAFQRELLAATESQADAPPVVAWEHYLSGRGIGLLYRAVCAVWDTAPAPFAAEEITRRALAPDGDPVCHTTMETWAGLLATAAGTLAATAMTLGGVYLAGSVPLAVDQLLRTARFRQCFDAAAWAADFLAAIPLYLVVDPLAGLDGAALLAASAEEAPPL